MGVLEPVPPPAQPDDHVASDPPETITQLRICRRLGISDETWRRWRKAGLTPRPVAMPGRPRWLVSDIEAFKRGRVAVPGRRQFFVTAARRRA